MSFDSRQIQRGHQFADAAFQLDSIRRLDGEALLDRLFERQGANAIRRADGGFEFPQQVVMCAKCGSE